MCLLFSRIFRAVFSSVKKKKMFLFVWEPNPAVLMLTACFDFRDHSWQIQETIWVPGTQPRFAVCRQAFYLLYCRSNSSSAKFLAINFLKYSVHPLLRLVLKLCCILKCVLLCVSGPYTCGMCSLS